MQNPNYAYMNLTAAVHITVNYCTTELARIITQVQYTMLVMHTMLPVVNIDVVLVSKLLAFDAPR